MYSLLYNFMYREALRVSEVCLTQSYPGSSPGGGELVFTAYVVPL